MGSGFKTFLLRGNLVDMAVGIVIGIAFVAVVTAFVKDLITPIIAALFGKPDFSGLYFTINHSKFLYGDFFNVIVALRRLLQRDRRLRHHRVGPFLPRGRPIREVQGTLRGGAGARARDDAVPSMPQQHPCARDALCFLHHRPLTAPGCGVVF